MCNGNKGNRSCSNNYLEVFLRKGYSLATFDYNGLGHSEKLPLSYGFHEKNDLRIFLELL